MRLALHYPEMRARDLIPTGMFISRDELLLQGPSKTSKVPATTALVSTSGKMAEEEESPVLSGESVPPPVSTTGAEDSTERAVEPSRPDSPLLDPRRQSKVPSAKLNPSLAPSTGSSVAQPKKVVVKVNGAFEVSCRQAVASFR